MESYTKPDYIKVVKGSIDTSKPITLVWDQKYIPTSQFAAETNSLTQNKIIVRDLANTEYFMVSDIGGPSTIMLLTELHKLGFTSFKFKGSCGAINTDLEQFKWYKIESVQLISRNMIHSIQQVKFNSQKGITKSVNVSTTDYFFKEDKTFIDMALNGSMKTDVVDMEAYYIAEWWLEHPECICEYALQVCDVISEEWTANDLDLTIR